VRQIKSPLAFLSPAIASFASRRQPDMLALFHERLSSPTGESRANGKAVKTRRGRAAVKDIFGLG